MPTERTPVCWTIKTEWGHYVYSSTDIISGVSDQYGTYFLEKTTKGRYDGSKFNGYGLIGIQTDPSAYTQIKYEQDSLGAKYIVQYVYNTDIGKYHVWRCKVDDGNEDDWSGELICDCLSYEVGVSTDEIGVVTTYEEDISTED